MKTQNERIKDMLAKHGCVTRNWCLRSFPAITRLSARINDLEQEGYEFEGKNIHGDYCYTLIKSPAPKQLTLI